MKRTTLVLAAAAALLLSGACSAPEAEPAPTVTVTETAEAPAPEPAPTVTETVTAEPPAPAPEPAPVDASGLSDDTWRAITESSWAQMDAAGQAEICDLYVMAPEVVLVQMTAGAPEAILREFFDGVC